MFPSLLTAIRKRKYFKIVILVGKHKMTCPPPRTLFPQEAPKRKPQFDEPGLVPSNPVSLICRRRSTGEIFSSCQTKGGPIKDNLLYCLYFEQKCFVF